MNRTAKRLLLTLAPFMLVGCHLALGPHGGRQEWWSFCDQTGCYRCNIDGCEMPDTICSSDAKCPSGMFCDTTDGTCRSKTQCTTSSQCSASYICSSGKCIPGRLPCDSNAACGDGAYCSNGACKNTGKCVKDADCASWGTGFICEARGTCVPGAPPIASCQGGSSCTDGLCIDGQCGACSGDCGAGKTCEIDRHCGTGRVCVDAQCASSCAKTADCASSQLCRGGVCVDDTTSFCLKTTECGSGKICGNNFCFEDCTRSGTCSNPKDVCTPSITVGASSVKLCKPNHAAKLECAVSKDCTGGETCVNGICRTACVGDVDCAACSDGPVCGKGGFCMTAPEAAPQCKKNADCSGGKFCLNAQCVVL